MESNTLLTTSEIANKEIRLLYANDIGLFPPNLIDVSLNKNMDQDPTLNPMARLQKYDHSFNTYRIPPLLRIYYVSKEPANRLPNLVTIESFIYNLLENAIQEINEKELKDELKFLHENKKDVLRDDYPLAWMESYKEATIFTIAVEFTDSHLSMEKINFLYWLMLDFTSRNIKFPTSWMSTFDGEEHIKMYIMDVKRGLKTKQIPFVQIEPLDDSKDKRVRHEIYESTSWCETVAPGFRKIQLNNTENVMYTAILDNEYVGFALVFPEPNVWEVKQLCSRRNITSFRIGSNLMAKIEYDAYASGIRRIEIESLVESFSFYLKIGYLFKTPIIEEKVMEVMRDYERLKKTNKYFDTKIEIYFDQNLPRKFRKNGDTFDIWDGSTISMFKVFSNPPQEWKEWNSNFVIHI